MLSKNLLVSKRVTLNDVDKDYDASLMVKFY